ncbi:MULTISPECIES: pyruvate, water dikinase regulatory protein [Acidiphilium]|jgi:regulator of PEP synthase PpsR (kinase-PPPase family)|nr:MULTISPECIES: pyruvate, water dikinase regulatory protein [Acidiphilium]MBU6357587.1 kinase/pyrophosphorylase [Rhodospirillales bacterium]EGO95983.1 Putative phosphotransferase [Acidiphilium sp. PM]KDM66219.1 putative pyruvate, phosphate dikinase regulatory protein [Acidiphilium sp. JA12-A1]MBS3022942.1 kinase/pyrophosphorylase [Acidiphilium multivorum]UNC14104.1 kinase/pyrophosphorylase [Acidiphilium multivorum]
MDGKRLNLHLVSDATGDTLNAVARAASVQFEGSDIHLHRWSLIRSRLQLHRVLEGIEAERGPVLCSLLDQALRHELDEACQRLGLRILHVLDPVFDLLAEELGTPTRPTPGRQYVLDADYFRRIDAMHFVLSHDDGQALRGLAEADVILVGVSRSSKTPTSFYLANRGIKAANVPMVPGIELPGVLDDPPCPVVGLFIDAEPLIEIRRHRLTLLGQGGGAAGAFRPDSGDYVDEEAVKAELLWARRTCSARGWPTVNVTRRSIEETAAAVLKLMDAWHERRRRTATSA